MHTTPPALSATSATERAYQYAKDAILSRRFAGGELISEGAIASEVGVSRTPVREALLRLEAEGFIRLFPKRGALIVPVSQDEIDDVVETRRLVEGFTAEQAAAAGSGERTPLVARLTGLLDRMHAELEADRRAFIMADREFHHAIITASGNGILIGLYESLRDRQLRMMEEGARTAERMRRNIDEHTVILEAIRDGDREAVRAAVTVHMDSVGRYLGARR